MLTVACPAFCLVHRTRQSAISFFFTGLIHVPGVHGRPQHVPHRYLFSRSCLYVHTHIYGSYIGPTPCACSWYPADVPHAYCTESVLCLGMTMLHGVTGAQPWTHLTMDDGAPMNQVQLVYNIPRQISHPLPEWLEAGIAQIIHICIAMEPKQRPTAEALYNILCQHLGG